MKTLIGVILAALVLPVFAAGVHKDDIRYQPLVDRLTPTFETVVRGLTLGNNEYDQLSVIADGKSTLELCQQLFSDELTTDPTYCDTGLPGRAKTQDLQQAGACLNRLYDQAKGVTVSPTEKNCFADLYKFIETR